MTPKTKLISFIDTQTQLRSLTVHVENLLQTGQHILIFYEDVVYQVSILKYYPTKFYDPFNEYILKGYQFNIAIRYSTTVFIGINIDLIKPNQKSKCTHIKLCTFSLKICRYLYYYGIVQGHVFI